MQSNTLYSYFADDSSLTIHDAKGASVAHITDGKVIIRTSVPLRPGELEHLADVAERFADFHGVAFADQNYSHRLMPLLPL